MKSVTAGQGSGPVKFKWKMFGKHLRETREGAGMGLREIASQEGIGKSLVPRRERKADHGPGLSVSLQMDGPQPVQIRAYHGSRGQVMDVLTLHELADQLGGISSKAEKYNEVVLTPAHVKRLDGIESAKVKFPGITIMASPLVPDGYGVLRQDGKVIGVINFIDGTSLTLTHGQK